MTRKTAVCDRENCTNEYTYAGGRETDSLFVSYSVSPHDVEDVEKRAFSLCEECALEIDPVLEQGVDDDRDVDVDRALTRLDMLEDVLTSTHDDAAAEQAGLSALEGVREALGGENR